MTRQEDKSFAGDKKVGASVMSDLEKKLVLFLTPKVPSFIQTHHLTLLTLLWSLGTILFGVLAQKNLVWLIGVNCMVILQYLTDILDGAVGRHRQTGLIKWGFFMDHLLDYIFLISLMTAGYLITPPNLQIFTTALAAILSCILVANFLHFATTNKFQVYHFGLGPTEFRLAVLCFNFFVIFAGTDQFYLLLPLGCLMALVALLVYVIKIHRELWELDNPKF
ncbi:MAG: hypothetical protein NZO16_03190 [Deltaproteobacteria bacterium]|nr:hypothetical protein [Deltaproteobacteria bacterium]